jgi:hypothetical protein
MSARFDMFEAKPSTGGSIVGIKVRLDRDIDLEKPCHDNFALIHPGKAPHAGEVRCAACGAHRGWLSQATRNFILERFGDLAPRINPSPCANRREQ